MSNQISIVGNLSNGVIVLDEANIDFPTNPTPGMLVMKGLDLYAYITVAGVLKWYSISQHNTVSNYVGTQSELTVSWLVQHDLNTTDYYYQVKDNNGVLITPLQLIPIDNNSFRLLFSSARSGTIAVIGTSNLHIDDLTIGDGEELKLTRGNQEQLNIVAGDGIELTFDNVAKTITITNTAKTGISNSMELTNVIISSVNTSLENTIPNQVIDFVPASLYSTIKYLIQVRHIDSIQCTELTCVIYGQSVYLLTLYEFYTGNNALASFDANISSDNFQLLAIPTTVGLDIVVVRTAILAESIDPYGEDPYDPYGEDPDGS